MGLAEKLEGDAARDRLSEALGGIAAGDESALQQVYELTSAKLFGICLRISRDSEGAEDILQNVYVKIWNRAGRFDARRASPITWLAAIARNSAIDWCRANRRPGTVPEDAAASVADPQPLADMAIERSQQRSRIFFCLENLEARQQASIRDAFYGGSTYLELAERMNVPLGTVKSWIRRGLQRLKECVGDA